MLFGCEGTIHKSSGDLDDGDTQANEQSPDEAGLGGRCPEDSTGEAHRGTEYAALALGSEESESHAGTLDESVVGRDE